MSVSSDLTIVRSYCTRTAAQTVRLADALVRLNTGTGKQSVRAIADAIADTDAPLGKTRIALIIRARRANPTADADTFRGLLAEATTANTGTRAATADTADTAVTASAVTDALATGPADAVSAVTVDALTDRLADLFEAARSLSPAELSAFLSAVDAEVAYSAPVIVAVPVAA